MTVEIDPHDGVGLREYWKVEQAAQRHDRDDPVLRTLDSLAMVGEPQPYYAHTLLAARVDGAIVGTADIGCSLVDNTHLAEVEIDVLPDRRRRGIGSALLEAVGGWCHDHGRTTLLGEVNAPYDADPATAPSHAFATARGFASVHVEDHLRLALPADPVADPQPVGYEVLTWGDHCPEEHLEAWCSMRTQMDADVPTGEIDLERVVIDPERVRVQESRTVRLHRRVVAVATADDGTFAGYSVVFLPHGTTQALQDDTLVMPDHRGHRLGTALKLATLAIVARDHPERDALHTWSAVDNGPMQHTNLAFGYRPIERCHEMQRKDR